MAIVKCTECRGEVSESAAACPHCGHPRSVAANAKKSPGCLTVIAMCAGGFFMFLALLAVIGSMSKSPATNSDRTTESQAPPPEAPVLMTRGWTFSREYDYITAEGRVTNISPEPLRYVQAVVTFTTKSGDFVTTDESYLDYNPIMPGQTSSWKIMLRDNPVIALATLEFKARGERLFSIDDTTRHRRTPKR